MAILFSTCVVYTKTIVQLGVGESGGYLPRRFAAGQISTTVQLHLSEELSIHFNPVVLHDSSLSLSAAQLFIVCTTDKRKLLS